MVLNVNITVLIVLLGQYGEISPVCPQIAVVNMANIDQMEIAQNFLNCVITLYFGKKTSV